MTLDLPSGGPRSDQRGRLRLRVEGVVQGVGFRPFVHRIAGHHLLSGWVSNTPAGVEIEVEGGVPELAGFLNDLGLQAPAQSGIRRVESQWIPVAGGDGFEIRESRLDGSPTALIPADLATCESCLREVFDPGNRRHRYPFTNCTQCGPRFSIIEAVPYDRSRTSMRHFRMCASCRREYEDPADRRFHAEPNACPECGPKLQLLDSSRRMVAAGDEALKCAVGALRQGRILAVKGLGGFHLMTRARDEAAVGRLRVLKERDAKPFAVMFPSLVSVQEECEVSGEERQLLESPAAPIVLLKRRRANSLSSGIAGAVAPGNPYLGVMLPAMALHYLLLREHGEAVVATSGNNRGEPISYRDSDAFQKLSGMVDYFLTHDRGILRPLDDSIVCVVSGSGMVLRRSRGYAPLPVQLPGDSAIPHQSHPQAALLAVGGQLKNTVALSVGGSVFLSQHLGDLETMAAAEAHQQAVADLVQLHGVEPVGVVVDSHPDYTSTRLGLGLGLPVTRVQHHQAHLLACMAEHGLKDPVLGVIWDGSGAGPDGTVWGGELLVSRRGGGERIGKLRTFPLIGGEAAVREPARSALGVLEELGGCLPEALRQRAVESLGFSRIERELMRTAMHRRINSPRTSSIGRLFDAVSAILGLRQKSDFEGQAAMDLEFAATAAGEPSGWGERMHLDLTLESGVWVLNWAGLVQELIEGLEATKSAGSLAWCFHRALADVVVEIARVVRLENVVLSGGCFQNRLLLELVADRLKKAGFCPWWPRLVPPNDGGLALGQIVAARQEPGG